MNRLLLCPPDFYSIRYEINPWMDRAKAVDEALAAHQWADLCNTLTDLGCELDLVPAEPDWPDMVFTANAGLVHGQQVLLSNFRHAERSGEQPAFERWFQASGYEVMRRQRAWPLKGREMPCGSAIRFAAAMAFARMRMFT
jgi:N-dimethylarginine dimethylaminohydrolase